MPIDVTCGGCQRTITFGDEAAGRHGRCPECGERIRIPRPNRREKRAGDGSRLVVLWGAGIGVVLLLVLGGTGAYFLRPAPQGEDSPPPASSPKTPPASSQRAPSSSQRGPTPRIGDIARAQEIKLDSNGAASQKGRFETADDVDCYRFKARARGLLTVKQKEQSGDNRDVRLTVYNAAQKELTTAEGVVVHPRELSFRVTADETYYLKVAASGKGPAAYELVWSTQKDDFGDTFESAQPVTLSSSGFLMQDGAIDFPGDEDMFRFVATVTGKMTFWLSASQKSQVHTVLTVYEDARPPRQVARSEAELGLESLGSDVAIQAIKGRTYYVKVAAAGNKAEHRMGPYSLMILTAVPKDGTGESFDAARLLKLNDDGSQTQTGRLGNPGDKDYYRFVAPVSSKLIVRQEALEGSRLVLDLTAYDENLKDIMHFDADLGHLEFFVEKGRTYYLEVAAFQGGGEGAVTGPYRLTFTNAQKKSDWKEFSPEDGAFSVCLPEIPKEETEKFATGRGDLEMHMYLVGGAGSLEGGVGVLYAAAPEGVRRPAEVEKLFDDIRDALLTKTHGKLLNEKPIKLGTFTGREVLFGEDTTCGRGRMYLVDGRLYLVLAIGTRERVTSAKVESEFFATFKVKQQR